MPSIESLEQFNTVLVHTGNEPDIAASRGEEIEAVEAPRPGEFDAGSPAEAASATAEDFFSNLSESIEAAESSDDVDGMEPLDDFLNDLGLDDEADAGFGDMDFDLGGDASPEEFSDIFSGPDEDAGTADPLDFMNDADASEPEDFLDDTDTSEPDANSDEMEMGADIFGGDFGLDDEPDVDAPEIDDADVSAADFSEDDLEVTDTELPADTDDFSDSDDFIADSEDFSGSDDFMDEGDSEPVGADLNEFEDFGSDEFEGDDFLSDDINIDGDVEELGEPIESEDFDLDEFDNFDAAPDEDTGSIEMPQAEPVEDDISVPSSDEPGEFDFDDFSGDDFGDEFGGDDFGGDIGGAPDDMSDFDSSADFGSSDFGSSDFDMGDSSGSSDFGDFDSFDAGGESDFSTGAGSEDFGDFEDEFDSADFGDEFSMGDFGAEFGIMESEVESAPEIEEPQASADDGEDVEEADEVSDASVFQLSEEEFASMRQSLDGLPLNVKIATAEIIADPSQPFQKVKPLIDDLVAGKNPRDIASRVSRISGKKIEVPRGYEKRSGVSFEAEQNSFAYRFKENIWPILRLMLAGTAILSALVFVGYRFIYQPLYANSLYEQGLDTIYAEAYEEANDLFNRAYEIWPVNKRYLDYARAFRDERRFDYTRDKYETLLSRNVEPMNRDAILEYADFAAYTLRDYDTAQTYLKRLIDEDVWDYDARLARADVNLERGIQSLNDTDRDGYFEEARFDYAALMQHYGQTDELLFRMLRYFINTENVAEVLKLKDLFLQDENAKLSAYGMAELGGYLIDLIANETPIPRAEGESELSPYVQVLRGLDPKTGLLEDAIGVLNKAMAIDDEIPEIHYHRARYSRLTGDFEDEVTALRNTRELYESLDTQRPLTRGETAREIDTYIREGENFEKLDELIPAEQRYLQAVEMYQRALDAAKVEPGPVYGRAYAELGDLYYYHANNYSDAAQNFVLARQNGFGALDVTGKDIVARQDIAYKLGYIHFFDALNITGSDRQSVSQKQDLLDDAIVEFNNALGSIPTANTNLLYARANTQYFRRNYDDAASMYRILLEELTSERGRLSTFLLEEDDSHRALIDYQIRVNNNLGVTLYQMFLRSGGNDESLLAQSQLFLSRSAELSENFNRDEETAVRADSRPLAFLNLTRILAPEYYEAVQINPDIRKDLSVDYF